jgi:hypothetical protein
MNKIDGISNIYSKEVLVISKNLSKFISLPIYVGFLNSLKLLACIRLSPCYHLQDSLYFSMLLWNVANFSLDLAFFLFDVGANYYHNPY